MTRITIDEPLLYLDLSFLARVAADRADDGVFLRPDLVVVHLQFPVVPAANVDVVEIILPHLLEIHDLVSVKQRQ